MMPIGPVIRTPSTLLKQLLPSRSWEDKLWERRLRIIRHWHGHHHASTLWESTTSCWTRTYVTTLPFPTPSPITPCATLDRISFTIDQRPAAITSTRNSSLWTNTKSSSTREIAIPLCPLVERCSGLILLERNCNCLLRSTGGHGLPLRLIMGHKMLAIYGNLITTSNLLPSRESDIWLLNGILKVDKKWFITCCGIRLSEYDFD